MSRAIRSGVGLCAAIALCLSTSTATAQEEEQLEIDPIADGAIMSMGLGFALFSEVTIRSGELRPQAAGSPSNLNFLDRPWAERSNTDVDAGLSSDLAAGMLAAAVVLDAITNSEETAWLDLFLYAEVSVLNWAVANMAKLGVRRPRPVAYRLVRKGEPQDETDSALSFYSLHTSLTAGLASTATYLSFVRHDKTWRPWITMAAGLAVTSFVGYNRVQGGAHFPTDVIAGGFFGIGMGIIVPHLHRVDAKHYRAGVLFDENQGVSGAVLSGSW